MKTCPQNDVHTNVQSSFLHNCQDVGPTHMSINWGMGKPVVADPHHGLSLGRTRESTAGTPVV